MPSVLLHYWLGIRKSISLFSSKPLTEHCCVDMSPDDTSTSLPPGSHCWQTVHWLDFSPSQSGGMWASWRSSPMICKILCWGAGIIICLEWGANDLMPLLLHCFFAAVKSRIVLPFLYQFIWIILEKRPLNVRVWCVWCVCECACVCMHMRMHVCMCMRMHMHVYVFVCLQGEYTQILQTLQHCLDLWSKGAVSPPFKNWKKLQTSCKCSVFQIWYEVIAETYYYCHYY